MKSRVLPILILGLIITTILSPVIASAEQEGITLSPFFASIKAKPGDTTTVEFSVINTTTDALIIKPQLGEYLLQSETEVLTQDERAFQGARWIDQQKSDIENFHLDPREHKKLTVTFNIPEQAATGEYKPALILKVRNPDASSVASAATNVTASISFTVHITVSEFTPQDTIIIKNLDTPPVIITTATQLAYTIINNSKFYTKPIGYLQVLNPQRQVVFQQVINSELSSLLAGKEIDKVLGLNIVVNSIYDIGEYRVELLVKDAEYGTEHVKVTSFTLIPWWVGLLTVTGAVILITLAFSTIFNIRRKFILRSS